MSVAILVVMFACLAQAGVEKFGDLGTGEEGFYKHCFISESLNYLIDLYYRHRVGSLLGNDRRELYKKIDSQLKAFGDHTDCSVICHEEIVGRIVPEYHPEETEIYTALCKLHARYLRHCEMIKEKKSGKLRVIAIEKWLCLSNDALYNVLYSSNLVCQYLKGYDYNVANVPAFLTEAERGFPSVLSYSPEELREKQRESAEELASVFKRKKEFDLKIINEAYSHVNKGIDRIDQYIDCSKKEMVRKKARKEEQRKIERLELERIREESRRVKAKKEKKGMDPASALFWVTAWTAIG